MDEKAIRFRIGIFVLGSLILLAVMITLFGGFPNYFKQADTYTIVFQDAQGVAPGTPVRRSGVRIGEVRGLVLDNATGKVLVTIQVDSAFNLRKGDNPTIIQGLLGGDSSIAFLPPAAKEDPKGPIVLVPPGATLEGAVQADAQTLVQKTADVMPQAEQAMAEVKNVFKKLDKMMPLLEETFKTYQEIGLAAKDAIPELRKTNDEIRELSKAARAAVPEFQKAGQEIHELSKSARQLVPEFKKTNDEVQITSRQWTRVGERIDVLVATNEDKIVKMINQIDDTLRRVSQVFSDENTKNVNETLRNVKTGSARFDSIGRETEDFLKDSRETVKRMNSALIKTEAMFDDMQKAAKSISERSPSILKSLDEGTDKLNKTLSDVREIIGVIGRGDGTLQRLLSDPALFNNVNDTTVMINKMLPRLDRALRDLEIFADKLARHPELLGIGGAVRPSSGVKETHSVIPWR